MRYIDADVLVGALPDCDVMKDMQISKVGAIADFICIIADQPTVDAVPVVHCKNCKYWWKSNELCTHARHCDSNLCIHECKADDYCSDGEKRVRKCKRK